MQKLRMGLWIIGLVLVLIFTIQNIQAVTVTFLAWNVSMSQAILVVVLVGMGFTGGWLTARIRQARSK